MRVTYEQQVRSILLIGGLVTQVLLCDPLPISPAGPHCELVLLEARRIQ